MPNLGKRVVHQDSSNCSAPHLATSSPPPAALPDTRRRDSPTRPRAPLRAIKAEVQGSKVESIEFVADDKKYADVKPSVAVKLEPDPRQTTARVAAIAVRQPDEAASTSTEEAHRPGYRGPPLDPFGLRQHLEGQRRPRPEPACRR